MQARFERCLLERPSAEESQVGGDQVEQRRVVVPVLLEPCDTVPVHLVFAEAMERRHIGKVTEFLLQVGNQIADEGKRKPTPSGRTKDLLEGMRLAGARTGDNKPLLGRRVDDRVCGVPSELFLVIGARARSHS